MPWHTLRIDGISRIEREVARFLVEPTHPALPMGFRIKIVEHQDGRYSGHPEVALCTADGTPDMTCGWGSTIEETLSDTVKAVLDTAKDKPEDASLWWDPRF